MSSTEASRWNRYRYAIASTRMTVVGSRNDRSACNNRVHGVVRVTSTTREIDTATRMTMSPADSKPSAVSPTGPPNQ